MGTARTKANNKWNAKAYDRINLTMPKGRKAEIQAHAETKGESVNGEIFQRRNVRDLIAGQVQRPAKAGLDDRELGNAVVWEIQPFHQYIFQQRFGAVKRGNVVGADE